MDSTFCPCHTILALCRGTPQHLGSFPPPQLLLESYKTVLSPGTPPTNKTYRREASFNFIADRPKKAGLRPLLAPKVQALPHQAVRTPCRPLPTRFNSIQDHFPQQYLPGDSCLLRCKRCSGVPGHRRRSCWWSRRPSEAPGISCSTSPPSAWISNLVNLFLNHFPWRSEGLPRQKLKPPLLSLPR